ncbi:MAG: bifunctional adenosylcobinamide kinase/adenosylcobinamide-phosphate guanylyltransferase [Deltaproteobacteria bacterium]|nr:MAG: bifunctional adenosylcobinamide kinase/adenosylcobinamide-phosphate guanylyltransferase [Deltaproteobacteria bacterium]
MKILVTGGARSGKSRFAQARAEALHPRRFYLATAQALDAEMADRIARHRADRDGSWQTLEEPLDPGPLLRQDGVVLLDCLTLWVSNLLLADRDDADIEAAMEALVSAVATADNPVVLVTNEVGLGIVPNNPLARRFRDHSGRLSQLLAAVCDEVVLCVAGLPLTVKSPHNVER